MPDYPVDTLARLSLLDSKPVTREIWNELQQGVVVQFHDLPWELPDQGDVAALNEESQYAAWVLVHGYNVNHFTSLINSHQVPSLDDIEKTIAGVRGSRCPYEAVD